MLTGKWTPVNMRDRKKLRDLVEHHGTIETVAKLVGAAENTVKGWMDKEVEARFRSGARDKLKTLVQAMTAPPPPKKKKPELVAAVRETAFQFIEVPDALADMIEMRDALSTVISLLQSRSV